MSLSHSRPAGEHRKGGGSGVNKDAEPFPAGVLHRVSGLDVEIPVCCR